MGPGHIPNERDIKDLKYMQAIIEEVSNIHFQPDMAYTRPSVTPLSRPLVPSVPHAQWRHTVFRPS